MKPLITKHVLIIKQFQYFSLSSIKLNDFFVSLDVQSYKMKPLITKHVLIIKQFPIFFSFLHQIERLFCVIGRANWTCNYFLK